MALIAYAGKEDRPNPGYFEERCKRAYARFSIGQNTLQIAKTMGVSEATALRYVTVGRCIVKGLEIPY